MTHLWPFLHEKNLYFRRNSLMTTLLLKILGDGCMGRPSTLNFGRTVPSVPHKSPPMFSSMQRLRTWERSTMAESRFNGLALMNIHSNNDVGHIDQFKVLKILTKYFIHNGIF